MTVLLMPLRYQGWKECMFWGMGKTMQMQTSWVQPWQPSLCVHGVNKFKDGSEKWLYLSRLVDEEFITGWRSGMICSLHQTIPTQSEFSTTLVGSLDIGGAYLQVPQSNRKRVQFFGQPYGFRPLDLLLSAWKARWFTKRVRFNFFISIFIWQKNWMWNNVHSSLPCCKFLSVMEVGYCWCNWMI